MDILACFIFTFIGLVLFSQQVEIVGGDKNFTQLNHGKKEIRVPEKVAKSQTRSQVIENHGIIGAILDSGSREGKEARVAMKMALNDFKSKTNQTLILQIRNSQSNPLGAANAARYLINKQQVEAILGLHTWEEVSLIAEASDISQVPIVSLADSTPQWATARWPFLIQSVPSQYAQIKAVAAIVQSWEWHQITVIYEDSDLGTNQLFPHLTDALQEAGVQISNLVPIPPFASSSLPYELEKLMREQCRVFVVHASLPIATNLFYHAKRMKMMEKDYVWITTDMTTNLLHSLNASTISLMEGVLGIRSYFEESSGVFQDFSNSFRREFRVQHPEEDSHEPGIFAVQAYDATLMVAQALREANMSRRHLLEKISAVDSNGLSGKIQFNEHKLAPASIFQMVNVEQKTFAEIGFWTDGLGFSKTIGKRAIFNSSMKVLGPVFWPGKPWDTPRGWVPTSSGRSLKIGVPTNFSFKQYTNVEYDLNSKNYSYSGLSVNIFKETIDHLPYHLQYEFLPFDGTYDELVEQVYLKKFDAAAGDVSITASRYELVEFTHPYTESGLVMIAPVESQLCSKPWLFLKPFTKSMWALILLITIYSGFVVWFIERDHIPGLAGSPPLNQIGILLWLGFTTSFFLHGGKLHSNLSRIAMVVWLFVALILTQSYTASLTSMLTVQRLVPTVANVETLKNSNAVVGNGRGSFVANYLNQVLDIKSDNIKNFNSTDEYAEALKSGEITAAFLEVPFAKIFLAKYCKSFMIAGPTYKVGGFGFAFPKGSPLLPDVTKALLNLSESGRLRELENNMIGSVNCVDRDVVNEASLSPNSFYILFIFTGGTSTISLIIYVIATKWNFQFSLFQHRNLLSAISAIMKVWGHRRRRISRQISDEETAGNNPPNL